ncbi:MAG: hypothetical protein AAF690_22790 [Acidobacteriota bacterium]
MRQLSTIPLLLATTALLLGCAGDSTASEPAAEPTPESAPAPAPAGGTPITAEGLTFNLPDGWTPEEPSSSMRIGQATIPGSGGAGQLAVFFFGPGGGGGAEANISRWVSQVASSDEPLRETFASGNLSITWIDSSGTLKRSTIGSFPTEDMPDYRLFGAVVEGEGGPWFLKAVGPQATMAEQRDAFIAMLKGATLGG